MVYRGTGICVLQQISSTHVELTVIFDWVSDLAWLNDQAIVTLKG